MTAIEILFLKSVQLRVAKLFTGSTRLREPSEDMLTCNSVYSCSVMKEGKPFGKCKANNHICHKFSCRI